MNTIKKSIKLYNKLNKKWNLDILLEEYFFENNINVVKIIKEEWFFRENHYHEREADYSLYIFIDDTMQKIEKFKEDFSKNINLYFGDFSIK